MVARIHRNADRVRRLLAGHGFAAALPESLRRHAESLFRADLSDVRVRVSRLVADLGCRALACGRTVYFAPGAWVSGSAEAVALVGHELAHVVQQAQGRVRGTGVVVSAELEEEADLAGAVFATTWEDGRGGLPALRFDDRTESAGPVGRVLQPVLLVGGVKQTNAEKLLQTLESEMKKSTDVDTGAALGRLLTQNRKLIRDILKEWISTSESTAFRVLARQKAVSAKRDFPDFQSLAFAVVGESISRPNLDTEKRLAKEAEKSGYIATFLNIVLGKLAKDVAADPTSTEKTKLLTRNGRYSWYYKLRDVTKVMTEPEKYSFEVKVAVLHDLSDYFYRTGARNEVPPEACVGTIVTGQNPDGTFQLDIGSFNHPDHFRDDNDLIRETHPVINSARVFGMPLCLGPSYTTGRVLQMTYTAGGKTATEDELTAAAWGMFAFWTLHYYQSVTGIHTFHEVMDMARNYGVPYSPYTYPKSAPEWA